MKYLNRLSDLLLILSRVAAAPDILWVPVGENAERDVPNVTVPPLDPDTRKKEW